MNLLKKIANKLLKNSVSQPQDTAYEFVGEMNTIKIVLPANHNLPLYQKNYKNYDKKLISISKIIYEKLGGVLIDIGANIGDTAAGIRANCDVPIFCIEGDEGYFKYLELNVKNLPNITLVKEFVGAENKKLTGNYVKNEGTGKFIENNKENNAIDFKTLENIFRDLKIREPKVTLLKIDTDGLDFTIILGNIDFIKLTGTSIFFEYEINTDLDNSTSVKLVEILSLQGYNFIAYDNFGNFLCSVTSDFTTRFRELNAYIQSCKKNGGGMYYMDIFCTKSKEIFNEVYKQEVSISEDLLK
jgi:FkbM family methyltransferase